MSSFAWLMFLCSQPLVLLLLWDLHKLVITFYHFPFTYVWLLDVCEKNVMSIRGLFALEFPVEMSSMTFPLSGWLIPFEIPAMLLGRVTALVNWSTAPAAASTPPLPPRARMMELAACRPSLMLCLAAVHCNLCSRVMGLQCFVKDSFFKNFFFLTCWFWRV